MIKTSTTLKLPTYSCDLVLTVTDDLQKEAKKIYARHKVKEDFGDDAEGAVITMDIDKYYLMLNTKFLTHNTIAHEIFHAVIRITEDRHIADEESRAWLSGHITQVMYKFLEKKNFTIKHGR